MKETKISRILRLMADGRPRDVEEIRQELQLTGVSQIVSYLYKRGLLLASPIIYTVELKKKGNRWFYSRKRRRWYIIANGRKEVRHEVSFLDWDRKTMKNLKKHVTLTFKLHQREERRRRNISKEVYEHIAKSPVALFSCEVADALGIRVPRVVRALYDHYRYGRLKRAGWFNPDIGREVKFQKGWLYYVNVAQLEERLARRDLLAEGKQRIYDYILKNTKIQRRFTPRSEICEELGYSPKDITSYIREIAAVYKDLVTEEIGGEVFYYISNILTKNEIENQRNYWNTGISKERSLKKALGHAHERFVQVGLDEMWKRGDFKIKDYFWEFTIGRDGKKKYNVYKVRASNPTKVYEFDRILHCILSGPKEREIILVFEMKYRGDLNQKLWDEFITKLADTYDLGTELTTRTDTGTLVRVRVPKMNVVPVIVVPWKGKENIEVEIGGQKKKVNFAKYVTMQGGIVIFTDEIEKYLSEKLGKKINFRKFFKNWYKTTKGKENFTEALINYIFGQNPEKNEKTPNN